MGRSWKKFKDKVVAWGSDKPYQALGVLILAAGVTALVVFASLPSVTIASLCGTGAAIFTLAGGTAWCINTHHMAIKHNALVHAKAVVVADNSQLAIDLANEQVKNAAQKQVIDANIVALNAKDVQIEKLSKVVLTAVVPVSSIFSKPKTEIRTRTKTSDVDYKPSLS